MNRYLLIVALVLGFTTCAVAQEAPEAPEGEPVVSAMQLDADVRAWFRNPDGSCVQCSIGMCGVHCNDIRATTLLWDTEYGPKEHGGSWPARVANYCNARGIHAYNITGEPSIPWARWATKTGRFAAIGAGRAHFQTLYGYNYERKKWLVCNNNSTHNIDEYDEDQFRQLHYASGPWIVVLSKPSSENPVYTGWNE